MVKTCIELIPFIQDALKFQKYINLAFEDDSNDTFFVDSPRYHKHMNPKYCRLPHDWYKINPHLKPETYTYAMAVLKAAMRKSPYLVFLSNRGKRLRFRFATPEEVIEKRKLQKERLINIGLPSVRSTGHSSDSDNTLLEQRNQQAEILTNNFEYDSGILDFQANTDEVELTCELDSLDTNTSTVVENISDIPQTWLCNSKVIVGSVVQYVFQSEINSTIESFYGKNETIYSIPLDVGDTIPGKVIDLGCLEDSS